MKALIIEDDTNQMEFIRAGLLRKGYECDCSADGQEGYFKLTQGDYAVAVIDYMLPSMDGFEIVRRIREERKNPPVMILQSQCTSTAHRVSGLDRGADDYICKPYSMDELIARINACQRRRIPIDADAVLAFEDLTCNSLTHQVMRDGKIIELQPLEYSLLEYLLRNPGRHIAYRLILEQVWDADSSMSKRAVEVRISSLRKKLTQFGGRDIIDTIPGLGYGIK